MSERIRTFLAVAVLTLAVWVWADLEQTDEGEEQVPVQINVPANFTVRELAPESITVTFTGPSGEIQDLKASATDRVCRFDLTEAQLGSDRLVLPARDGFKHWAKRRVVVDDVKDDRDDIPDGEIHVTVVRIVRIKVRVQPQVTGAEATAATASPHEVTARVAESDLKALPDTKRFVVALLDIDVVPEDLQVEQEVTLDRHLGGADGIEASFDPPIVKVSARFQSAVTTKRLGRFPILIVAPPEMLNRYRIVFQPEAERWVELEVEGATPAVERLKPQDIRVQLVLTEDDKPNPGSWLPREPVVVGLPPGIKLAKPVPTVNFNLEKHNEKPPTP